MLKDSILQKLLQLDDRLDELNHLLASPEVA